MNKVISSLEHITRSKECRVGFTKRGKHFFGGTLENLEISWPGTELKLHHLFTIDTSDPFTPIRFSETQYLPLVFPLGYEDGSHISYLLRDELEIEVTSTGECRRECKDFPKNLPLRKAKLVPLTYAERRILHSDIRERSIADERRMKRLWGGQAFRVSGLMNYSPDFGLCPSSNSSAREPCCSWKFATFPATEVPFGDIWGDYSSDVSFDFYLCIRCNQIHGTVNCT